jgi:hypothetical protein
MAGHFTNGRQDILISAATADISAHQLTDIRIRSKLAFF